MKKEKKNEEERPRLSARPKFIPCRRVCQIVRKQNCTRLARTYMAVHKCVDPRCAGNQLSRGRDGSYRYFCGMVTKSGFETSSPRWKTARRLRALIGEARFLSSFFCGPRRKVFAHFFLSLFCGSSALREFMGLADYETRLMGIFFLMAGACTVLCSKFAFQV